MRRCRSEDTIAPPSLDIADTMPTMPAPGSQCPTRDFAASSTSASCVMSLASLRSTAVAAPTSIGSPSEVPVPCISSCPMLSADVDDKRIVLAMSACWDGPFGAVSELDRPSWLTPLPDINADASEVRATCFATCTTPQHSPRPYPSADASRVLHRPSADSIRAAASVTRDALPTDIATPAAKQDVHSVV